MGSTYYQQRIISLLDVSEREAVFVEAWLRCDHGTLDGIDAASFKFMAMEAMNLARATPDEENVRLAASFGFSVPTKCVCGKDITPEHCLVAAYGTWCCPDRVSRRLEEEVTP